MKSLNLEVVMISLALMYSVSGFANTGTGFFETAVPLQDQAVPAAPLGRDLCQTLMASSKMSVQQLLTLQSQAHNAQGRIDVGNQIAEVVRQWNSGPCGLFFKYDGTPGAAPSTNQPTVQPTTQITPTPETIRLN